MDRKDLKKLLAGIGIAGLIGGAGAIGANCATTQASQMEGQKSSCSGGGKGMASCSGGQKGKSSCSGMADGGKSSCSGMADGGKGSCGKGSCSS